MISGRYNICFLFSVLALVSLLVSAMPSGVLAQEKLEVRASNKSDYSRLVFDGKGSASYTVEKQGGALIISFKGALQANIGDVEGVKNIGTVSLLSGQGEALKFSVSIPAASEYRHFKIGKCIIVDVYDSEGQPLREESSPVPKEPVQEKKVIKAEPAAESLKALKTLEETDGITIEGTPYQASPLKAAEVLDAPHVITMSATHNVGVAVFERAGYLWIVQDDPSLKVPPSLSGPHKGDMGEFEEVKIEAGKAYRIKKPEGVHFYGEGGGLLWRVVMSPNPRDKAPIQVETKESIEEGMIKRSLFWPLNKAQKVLTFRDPFVGDEIKVVTVGDSAQTIGPARRMIEMQVLPSIVGLAVVPYIDDLAIKTEEAGVHLLRPLGLSVSPVSQSEAFALSDDAEKEKQLFDEIDNPRDMSQIFDFPRWEMGGEKAFFENRRVLMVSGASKQDMAQVENLITLAKLHLANDRGPEALGLFHVIALQLPGIDETPEFVAMRGAAAVLASKYDEAIEDLSIPSIQRYDEINYWKAAALAGLEDWRQADATMPTQLHILEGYPSQIRQPLVLALTEIALRGGDTKMADTLLSMLEEEFKDMSLPRRSAWTYLTGEKERQSGELDKALKSWKTLLTGKDDYYRAKAGLSVTRMQLERQKITPSKAIDLLEGLRYAWRGDELETLVNYRLGQVYIDNGEYLKGLSVLRNTVSLSPNSGISQEVTNYMTEAFQKLFTDGTLENVSPLDAVSIYDEFKELTPAGEEGNVFVQNLAERLVNVDLLSRAASLLEDQMNYRLEGADKVKVAIRLAAIRLLDDKPDGALRALDVAQNGVGDDRALQRKINMLRARALSQKGEANKALSTLKGMSGSENLARLRADISWNGGLWNDSARAFKDLLGYASIAQTRPMDEYQENLVLNYSIALNLSGNRTGLANVRKTYGALMTQSKKARIFDLVTRPRQLGMLADRESITSLISEVDLFGGFLENYKSSN